jgi:hypothetical protein
VMPNNDGTIENGSMQVFPELRDPAHWVQVWLKARSRLAEHEPGAFNRWDTKSPLRA